MTDGIINLSATPTTSPRLNVVGKNDTGVLNSVKISTPRSVFLESPKSVSRQSVNFGPGIEMFMNPKKKNDTKTNHFVVAGGVAANKKIREMLINLCKEENFKPIFPPKELCGDNAAMIAMVGLEKYKLNQFTKLDHPAIPRWPLDESAAFLKGAGVKF